jgi:hypothetical protein
LTLHHQQINSLLGEVFSSCLSAHKSIRHSFTLLVGILIAFYVVAENRLLIERYCQESESDVVIIIIMIIIIMIIITALLTG